MNPPERRAIRVALTKEEPSSDLQTFVEILPKWRDATLVLAGLAYVLGYLSWAIYASEHGWGLAPVLDAQYFAAGVLPALIVISACFLGWWLRWLSQWVRKPVSSRGATIKSILETTGSLSVAVGFVFILLQRGARVGAGLVVSGVVALIVSSFFSRKKMDSWYHRFVLALAWVQLPLIGLSAFLFYIAKIFPGLPQPLGGPRAQCVQLDLDVSKVSAATLQLLAPDWPAAHNGQSGVARSRNLYLVLQSNEFLFVQTSRETSSTTNQPFRIRSSEVTSVIPAVDDQAR